jgi:hypothetical protein
MTPRKSHPRIYGSWRRGQGAFEYLMTYSWAILVVMIVGLTFWQMGMVSQSDSSVPTVVGFTFFKFMAPSSSANAGIAVLYFQNQQSSTIDLDLTQSTVKNKATGVTCPFVNTESPPWYYPDSNPASTINPVSIPPNSDFVIQTQCMGKNTAASDLEVNIVYHTILGGQIITKGDHGVIRISQGSSTNGQICQDPFRDDIYKRGMACEPYGYCNADFCLTGGIQLAKMKCAGYPPGGGAGISTTVINCPHGCVNGACVR